MLFHMRLPEKHGIVGSHMAIAYKNATLYLLPSAPYADAALKSVNRLRVAKFSSKGEAARSAALYTL